VLVLHTSAESARRDGAPRPDVEAEPMAASRMAQAGEVCRRN
jgi:hypothetical protein